MLHWHDKEKKMCQRLQINCNHKGIKMNEMNENRSKMKVNSDKQ